eukprot:765034-Hanusia_phi.AAC.3
MGRELCEKLCGSRSETSASVTGRGCDRRLCWEWSRGGGGCGGRRGESTGRGGEEECALVNS